MGPEKKALAHATVVRELRAKRRATEPRRIMSAVKRQLVNKGRS